MKANGMNVIDDCYNANPVSMEAAMDVLSHAKGRTIAVLGDMLELGDYSEKAHRNCGRYAAENGVDVLFAYGNASSFSADEAEKHSLGEIYHYTDELSLAEKLSAFIKEGDAVLFKASRGMKLENIIHYIYDKMQ